MKSQTAITEYDRRHHNKLMTCTTPDTLGEQRTFVPTLEATWIYQCVVKYQTHSKGEKMWAMDQERRLEMKSMG